MNVKDLVWGECNASAFELQGMEGVFGDATKRLRDFVREFPVDAVASVWGGWRVQSREEHRGCSTCVEGFAGG
jgi:hypothetical protein